LLHVLYVGGWRRFGIAKNSFLGLVLGLTSLESIMLVTILVVLLILALLGGGYGYRNGNGILGGAGGLLGLCLVVFLVLYLLDYVHV
jgi:hypothetical protein